MSTVTALGRYAFDFCRKVAIITEEHAQFKVFVALHGKLQRHEHAYAPTGHHKPHWHGKLTLREDSTDLD